MRGSVALRPLFLSSSALVMGVGRARRAGSRRLESTASYRALARVDDRRAAPSRRPCHRPSRAVAPPSLVAPARSAGCQSLQSSDSFLGVITPYRIEVVQGNVVTSEQVALAQARHDARPGARRARLAAARRPVPRRPLGLRLHDPAPGRRAAAAHASSCASRATCSRRIEGGADLPSEHEFVASIDTCKTARNAPPLELTDEQLKALPAPARPPPPEPPSRRCRRAPTRRSSRAHDAARAAPRRAAASPSPAPPAAWAAC